LLINSINGKFNYAPNVTRTHQVSGCNNATIIINTAVIARIDDIRFSQAWNWRFESQYEQTQNEKNLEKNPQLFVSFRYFHDYSSCSSVVLLENQHVYWLLNTSHHHRKN
jgi:hypothetical protein